MANRIACLLWLATTVSATAAQPFDGSWQVNVATQNGSCGAYSSEIVITEGHSNSAGRAHLWVRQCVTSRPNRSGVHRRHVVDQSVWPSKEIISARTMASPELIVLRKLAGLFPPPVIPGERHTRPFCWLDCISDRPLGTAGAGRMFC